MKTATTTKPTTVETKPEAKEPRSFGINFASKGDVGLWLRAYRTKVG